MSDDIATRCIAGLVALIEEVPEFKGKTFHVYSEEELLDKQKGLLFPCVGVLYDGMREFSGAATRPSGGGSGFSAELSMTVMAFFRSEGFSRTRNTKGEMVTLIDIMRSAIRHNRSASGHWWRFKLEASVPGRNGLLVYLQRWHTTVQLT